MDRFLRITMVVMLIGFALIFWMLAGSQTHDPRATKGIFTAKDMAESDLRPFARSKTQAKKSKRVKPPRFLRRGGKRIKAKAAKPFQDHQHTFTKGDARDEMARNEANKKNKADTDQISCDEVELDEEGNPVEPCAEKTADNEKGEGEADSDEKKELAEEERQRLKDKEKELAEVAKENLEPSQNSEENPEESQLVEANNDSGPIEGFIIPRANRNGNTPTENSDEYEKWADLVLRSPHFGNTTDMIAAFKGGELSEGTFYIIVDEMLADPRAIINEYGINAASSTPGYRSYISLTNFMAMEPTSNPLRRRAESELEDDYLRLDRMDVLTQALIESDSTYAVSIAADYVNRLAIRYLSAGSGDSDNGSDGGDVTSSSTDSNASYFVGLIEPLQNLVDAGGSVGSTASQTLSTLQELLDQSA